MTQIEEARKGNITKEMAVVAQDESLAPELIAELIAEGKVVIPYNPKHGNIRFFGIGKNLRTKVNVNIGSSDDFPELENELKKVEVSLKYQTDTIMDLSTGGDIRRIRTVILDKARIPLGTVPLYEVAIRSI